MNGRVAVLLVAIGVVAADQTLKALLGHPLLTPATTASIVAGFLVLVALACAVYLLGWAWPARSR